VESVGITSDTASTVLSGTSMASLHVAGLAVYLMSLDSNLTTVSASIKNLAAGTGSVVIGVGANTTTLIAYNRDGF
jgi:subtilisin family serine protease